MIEKEIILGIERGGSPVSELEIRQMAGRCGRGNEKPGEVIILTNKAMADYAYECLNGEPKPIQSHFNEDFLFHILPSIIDHGIMSIEEMKAWYMRSFHYHQHGKLPDFEALIHDWLDSECVVKHKNGIAASEMGVLANKYYIKPFHALILKEKLLQFDGAKDLKAASWLLSYGNAYIDKEEHPEYDEYMSIRYSFDYDEAIEAFGIYMMFLPSIPKYIRHLTHSLRKEFPRRMGFLEDLSKMLGIDISNQAALWKLQFERRVPAELYHLLEFFPDASIPVLNELDSFNVRTSDVSGINPNHMSANLKKYLSKKHGRPIEKID